VTIVYDQDVRAGVTTKLARLLRILAADGPRPEYASGSARDGRSRG